MHPEGCSQQSTHSDNSQVVCLITIISIVNIWMNLCHPRHSTPHNAASYYCQVHVFYYRSSTNVERLSLTSLLQPLRHGNASCSFSFTNTLFSATVLCWGLLNPSDMDKDWISPTAESCGSKTSWKDSNFSSTVSLIIPICMPLQSRGTHLPLEESRIVKADVQNYKLPMNSSFTISSLHDLQY